MEVHTQTPRKKCLPVGRQGRIISGNNSHNKNLIMQPSLTAKQKKLNPLLFSGVLLWSLWL